LPHPPGYHRSPHPRLKHLDAQISTITLKL